MSTHHLARQGLEALEPSHGVEASAGTVWLDLALPMPPVSLLILEPNR